MLYIPKPGIVTTGILISLMGGFSNYIYKLSKGETFNIFKMTANVFLAGFLGYIVQAFIDTNSSMFGPLLAITGFCAYPILQLLETKGPNLITNLIK